MTGSEFLTRVDTDPAPGWISLGPCPGRKDQGRDLAADIASIRASGAVSVLTLCEQQELDELGVGALGRAVVSAGLVWRHLPIPDFSTPSSTWELLWNVSGPLLRAHALGGHGIHLHCRGGCGRSGMIAARLLVELGVAPGEAIRRVRAARPCAIETTAQEEAIYRVMPQAA